MVADALRGRAERVPKIKNSLQLLGCSRNLCHCLACHEQMGPKVGHAPSLNKLMPLLPPAPCTIGWAPRTELTKFKAHELLLSLLRMRDNSFLLWNQSGLLLFALITSYQDHFAEETSEETGKRRQRKERKGRKQTLNPKLKSHDFTSGFISG